MVTHPALLFNNLVSSVGFEPTTLLGQRSKRCAYASSATRTKVREASASSATLAGKPASQVCTHESAFGGFLMGRTGLEPVTR